MAFHIIVPFIGLLLATIMAFMYWYFYLAESLTHIPGSYGFLGLDEYYEYTQNPLKFTDNRFEKFGKIFKTMFLGNY